MCWGGGGGRRARNLPQANFVTAAEGRAVWGLAYATRNIDLTKAGAGGEMAGNLSSNKFADIKVEESGFLRSKYNIQKNYIRP